MSVQMNTLADDVARLLEIIKTTAIVHRRVVLASGRSSDHYVDLRRVTLHAEGAPLVGRVLTRLTSHLQFDTIGGPSIGAIPVATSMQQAALQDGRRLNCLMVRPAAKRYGLKQRVEGPGAEACSVLAVEDMATTGGTVLESVAALEEAGARVVGVAALMSGTARKRVETRGLPFVSAFSLADLGLEATYGKAAQ